MNLRNGGLRIFRVLGINVYLHWSWLVAAFFLIQWNNQRYSSPVWSVFEYLALFAIVLLHEFGHALACRSVGGKADRIVLWPLGGAAYVEPPPRPGPMLWSIAAGPLVNVVLLPILGGYAYLLMKQAGDMPDNLTNLITQIAFINGGLLVFNLLPIYPLDGGKIVWSLLWFFMGRWHSLLVSTIFGLICAAGALVFAIVESGRGAGSWLIYIALYAAFNSWTGFQQARKMVKLNSGPKHQDFTCPTCRAHPPMGPLWRCSCGAAYDTFANNGHCPACQVSYATTQCSSCGARHPFADWFQPAFPVTLNRAVVPPPIPVVRIQ
jgi:Zn-dependent protease